MGMTVSWPSLAYRLTEQQAGQYAREIEQTRAYRATVFKIGVGAATVELRPLPGARWFPTRTLRTARECERVLAEIRQASEVLS